MIPIGKIREYIMCPQFGDKEYGAWGGLRLDQRQAYKDLIDIIEGMDKEIERLKEDNEYLNKVNIELSAEKNRLNNIINELEKHLYQEWLEWKDSECESIYSRAGEDKAIYDYIQELKGSDKE